MKPGEAWREPVNASQSGIQREDNEEMQEEKNGKIRVVSVNAVPGILVTITCPTRPNAFDFLITTTAEKLGAPFFLLKLPAQLFACSRGPCVQWHHRILASLLVDPITVTMAAAASSHG